MPIRCNFELLTVIFLGLTSVLGCSKLDDMQDKTDQMATTTQSMAEDSSALKGIGSHTYLDMRKSNSFDARKTARDCITTKTLLSDKLGCAKVYFFSFEFQSWKDEGLDDKVKLDIMKDEAVEEFFQFLTADWSPGSPMWKNAAPLSPSTLDLYAYGAAIHEIDPDQITQGQLKGFKAESLLTIIEDGLREEFKNPGHDPNQIPKWQYYVGVFKKNALDLMQKRITFMPLLAYAFLDHVETKTPFGLVFSTLRDPAITIYPVDEPTDRLDFIGLIIRRALMTRQFLNEINLDAVPDDSAYSNLNVNKVLSKAIIDPSAKGKAYGYKVEQIKKFQNWTNLLYAPRDQFLKVDPATYIIPQ